MTRPQHVGTVPVDASHSRAATVGAMIGFVAPRTGVPLWQKGEALVSAAGDRVPIIRGIPRFVQYEAMPLRSGRSGACTP